MSNLKKELRIVATLDDSGFKRQIESLKKTMGKELSFKGQDFSGIGDAFKAIAKDFAKELKEALKGLKVGGGSGGISSEKGISNSDPFIQEARFKAKQYRQDLAHQDKIFEKEQREKSKEYFTDLRNKEKLVAQESRLKDRDRKKEELANTRSALEEAKSLERTKKSVAASTRPDYSDTPKDFTGAMRDFTGDSKRKPASMREMISGARAAGATSLAVMNSYYDTREQSIERRDRKIQDISTGNILEGIARESGRSEIAPKVLGGGVGVAGGAALGSIAGPIGTIIGGIIGGLSGFFKFSNRQGELNVQDTQVLNRGFGKAQPLISQRLEHLAGGGVSGEGLSDITGMGAGFGYSAAETSQQYGTVKGILGNIEGSKAFGDIQAQKRNFGIDEGTGSNLRDIVAGTGRGTIAGSENKTFEIYKKAVAAGLDISKLPQFAKITADQVQKQAGIGAIDSEGVAGAIARIAQNIAGEGSITSTTLQQAKGIQDILQQQSTSMTGFSGIGNISGIQGAFKQAGANLGTGTMGSLLKMGSNASSSDIKTVLDRDSSLSSEQRNKLMEILPGLSGGNQSRGLGLSGVKSGSNLATLLGAEETGLTTPQQLAFEKAQGSGRSRLTSEQAATAMQGVAGAVQGSEEMQYQKAVASFDVTEITSGLSLMGTAASTVKEELENLSIALGKATDKLESYSGNKTKVNRVN